MTARGVPDALQSNNDPEEPYQSSQMSKMQDLPADDFMSKDSNFPSTSKAKQAKGQSLISKFKLAYWDSKDRQSNRKKIALNIYWWF